MATQRVIVGCLMLAVLQGSLVAQTPAAPAKAPTPLKVQIVLSRFEGDKKIASLPYTLIGSDGSDMTLNTGLQLAIPNSAAGLSNITYKPVGTNVNCRVQMLPDGHFSVDLTLDNSAVLKDMSVSPVSGLPAFQAFTMHNRLVLADGQTVQYASVTDPVTGQVTKVDITLSVVK
jgi:hypothetical protein